MIQLLKTACFLPLLPMDRILLFLGCRVCRPRHGQQWEAARETSAIPVSGIMGEICVERFDQGAAFTAFCILRWQAPAPREQVLC